MLWKETPKISIFWALEGGKDDCAIKKGSLILPPSVGESFGSSCVNSLSKFETSSLPEIDGLKGGAI